MPELPEVEFAVRTLRRWVRGATIRAITPLHPSQRRALPPRTQARIAGRRIVAVERLGKAQLLRLDDGAVLLAHFRLDGDWVRVAGGDGAPRFARLLLTLEGRRAVALTD
ncbi:MAG: hypothetical protein K2X99_13085, partial [Gemmatimonadaceae bacterium]|nr:hypothetical protein [Gemmatimonadaceae bacterium]